MLALCAIAWADGKVDPREAEGIRGAAQQLGLAAEDLTAVEGALGHRMGVEEVETIHKRVFDAIDANKDGKVTPEEAQAFMQ